MAATAVAAVSGDAEPPLPVAARACGAAGAPVRRRRWLAFTAAAAIAAATGTASGQSKDASLEASVKAAYLYKFIGYVEWPAGAFAQPGAPIVIGVAGSEAVHAQLQLLLPGRSIQGRPLVARRLAPGEPIEGLHVLFVGRDASGFRSGWLDSLAGRPVLIVTETPEGLARGSALNFVVIDGKVRFEASVPAAERASLKLSARLLAVAERVVAHP